MSFCSRIVLPSCNKKAKKIWVQSVIPRHLGILVRWQNPSFTFCNSSLVKGKCTYSLVKGKWTYSADTKYLGVYSLECATSKKMQCWQQLHHNQYSTTKVNFFMFATLNIPHHKTSDTFQRLYCHQEEYRCISERTEMIVGVKAPTFLF